MLVGNGFDIHRHSNDRKLILGGISLEGIGFEAHSDGDIILHSICDALLGATGKKDLGYYFPSNSDTPENISSIEMLKKILDVINFENLIINNIDLTLISEVINVSKISDELELNLSKLLDTDVSKINVKGKSMDKLGEIGEGIASAVMTTVSISHA